MFNARPIILTLMLLALGANLASASTPAEQIRCTTEPRTKWMTEDAIRKLFGADQYALVKFKISRTNCYEFYAVAKSGEIVEAYYHPVTGQLVKENRIKASTPERPVTKEAPPAARRKIGAD